MKDKIEGWMYRAPNEHLYLLVCLIIFFITSFLLSTFNFYVFVGLLAYYFFTVQLQQAQYLGSSVKVYEKQFPDIYEIFREYCIKLNINQAGLYINQDPTLNAYTLGITKCSVILSSAMVEQFNKEELSFVIAHELGHYKAGHTKISSFISPRDGNFISKLIFGLWFREGEYSADRCGLALTKNIDAGISTMVKLAVGSELFNKLNIDSYTEQIRKAQSANVTLSEFFFADHPLITNRIKALMKFWNQSFKKIK